MGAGVLPFSRLTMSCWLWTCREYRRNLPSSSHVDNAIPQVCQAVPRRYPRPRPVPRILSLHSLHGYVTCVCNFLWGNSRPFPDAASTHLIVPLATRYLLTDEAASRHRDGTRPLLKTRRADCITIQVPQVISRDRLSSMHMARPLTGWVNPARVDASLHHQADIPCAMGRGAAGKWFGDRDMSAALISNKNSVPPDANYCST